MELDTQLLAESHTADQIQERLSRGNSPDYLSDFVYGAIDGTVTTFAVVSGVAGADLSSNIVIVLGFANLVGDGFSMAASNYLGTRTGRQLLEKVRLREHAEVNLYPDGEREEIRQIYMAKGFSGDDLERAVEIITEDKERWVDTMLVEEMGLSLVPRSPLRAASATMLAFLIVGLVPLLAFVTQAISPDRMENPYAWSAILTVVAFFVVGAIKSRFVQQRWYWSGFETLFVGGSAAALAYVVGLALGKIVA